MKSLSFKNNLIGYTFIGPFVIGFLLFTLIPAIASLYFSVTDYDLLSTPSFIGFENYSTMFLDDSKFWASMKVTFLYVFIGVPLRLAFALFIAMILNTASKAIGLYRTVYYLPSIIGGSVAVSIMWRNLYGDQGVINIFLNALGLDSVRWFAEPAAALWMLITLSVWQFGSSMLIFLAGLKNIPPELYEASNVDGAGPAVRFFKITIPMLSPIILFNTIMQTIGAFMTFVPAYIISKGEGGPLDGTLLYSLYLFRQAFVYFDMGFASAMAWVMLIIIAILTGILFYTSKKWVHYESKGGH
ncbi:ABC transporter permease [Paenibacillus sp. FSL H8-0548]|uniref:carbohydrate ABC transporter permease n=1 Tax=Paenibacillus sp. FSL H8-0548 TaxID=1920422 RepID=UPI00096D7A5F|nr:sugar ABC transporter permease [Paenibacillus sp. FSL H8-0548]OMF38281.1 ABC transporter permease [Paenibacillus sp. FSL H8-0548]